MTQPKEASRAEALARYLKTSVRTARRIWAEPRADYELRARRSAPWQTEGISRATWYRRRGPEERGQPGEMRRSPTQQEMGNARALRTLERQIENLACSETHQSDF